MQQTAFQLEHEDIDQAFENEEFSLAYQPQITTSGGQIIGAEAYARWDSPRLGTIPTSMFLKFLENQGRMRELTNYVLRIAVRTASNWQKSGLNWDISLNISDQDLHDGTLAPTMVLLAREHELPPSRLTLDVSEAALVDDWDAKWPRIASALYELRDEGFKTALQSSGPRTMAPDQIDPQAFDQLKVGGAAILQYANGTRKLPFGFIRERIDLAKKNGLIAVGVGVQDQATLLGMKQLGFDVVQGHAICEPVDTSALADWRRTYVPPALYLTGTTAPAASEVNAPRQEDITTPIQDADWEEAPIAPSASSKAEPTPEVELEVVETSPAKHEEILEVSIEHPYEVAEDENQSFSLKSLKAALTKMKTSRTD